VSVIEQSPVSRRVMNLAYWLTQNARRLPNRPALVWREQTWSWTELDARVSALASVLAAKGVAPKSAVLVHSKNSNEMLESMLACFRLGAVWVPTNFRIMPDEIVYMADVAQPRVLLCQTDFPEHAAAVKAARPDTDILWLVGEQAAAADYPLLADLLQERLGTHMEDAPVESDAACWLFFTSGTTGRPKAAVLTHGQMAFVITNHLCDLLPGSTERDGSLVVAPLSHGAGVHQLNMIARGGQTVLLSTERFDVDEAFELIERHRLSNMFTVPTVLKLMVEHPAAQQRDHSSLRYVIYAGAPMYAEDQKRALACLGKVLVQYYGLGEVTGNITVLPAHEHEADGRPGTCGYERTGMQVSVQDDEGNELGNGQTGELCVIGPAVFAGYYNNPDANAQAFRNGWFRTGDLGYRDAEGYLYITGRASDMYISGGSNIYPREIEEKILTHQAISEVAIVGVPDPKWGEVGIAVCVCYAGHQVSEAELLAWMAERIAKYKLPRKVVFWDALPKSAYGKVPKRLVKDELERRGVVLASAVPAAASKDGARRAAH